MPRGPKGKRIRSDSGSFAVASKNQNGSGSVYFEPATPRSDGSVIGGRWRASYVDGDGKLGRVTAPTRALVEQRHSEALELVRFTSPSASRFSRATTVEQLVRWWLETGASSSQGLNARQLPQVCWLPVGRHRYDAGRRCWTRNPHDFWQSKLLDRYAPSPSSTAARFADKPSRRPSRSLSSRRTRSTW